VRDVEVVEGPRKIPISLRSHTSKVVVLFISLCFLLTFFIFRTLLISPKYPLFLFTIYYSFFKLILIPVCPLSSLSLNVCSPIIPKISVSSKLFKKI